MSRAYANTANIDRKHAGVQITYNGHLKLNQISRPDFSNWFDAILLNEGQDMNPVIAELCSCSAIPS